MAGPTKKGLVCFSGGKDSTAMLLRMLELNHNGADPDLYPISKIVFSDTTFEFPELYEYIERIQAYLDTHWGHLGLKIEKVHSKESWEHWFYGNAVRGKHEGKPRGAPLSAFPCWWSREAKVYPLQRAAEDLGADFQYIGIAHDEQKRINKSDPKVRYPLDEWKWTEADCLAYLDHLGLGNILYESFNRLGCFHCIKQPPSAWYQIWKKYPDQWKISLWWDAESIRITGRKWALNKGMALADMETRFKQGWIPQDRTGSHLDCRTCSAVAFHADGTIVDEDFDTDGAFERTDTYQKKYADEEGRREMNKTEWIPPSHLTGEHTKALSFDEMEFFCELPKEDEPVDMGDDACTDFFDLGED